MVVGGLHLEPCTPWWPRQQLAGVTWGAWGQTAVLLCAAAPREVLPFPASNFVELVVYFGTAAPCRFFSRVRIFFS